MRTNQRLKTMNEHLQDLSTTDPLLGIYNRLFFNKRIDYEFQRASRYGNPLTLLMLDLDNFKIINDTHGHPFGDMVLQKVADLLLASVRQVDIVARYGGEEFVVALPETNGEQAMIVAERIRTAIESAEFKRDDISVKVTISIGMAVCPDKSIASVSGLMKLADDALYKAKAAGRNCIRISKPDKPE
jgi:diguanylate cyclase (GGDEF)-like protein